MVQNVHNPLWLGCVLERRQQTNKALLMVIAYHLLAGALKTGRRLYSRIASNQLKSYHIIQKTHTRAHIAKLRKL